MRPALVPGVRDRGAVCSPGPRARADGGARAAAGRRAGPAEERNMGIRDRTGIGTANRGRPRGSGARETDRAHGSHVNPGPSPSGGDCSIL